MTAPPGPALAHPEDVRWRVAALASIALSLAAGGVLAFMHRTLSGPGDQLEYYTQAARLFPFTHNYYGPGYFAALRVIHDISGMGWFESGKLLSWMSAAGFLFGCHRLLTRALPGRYGYAAVMLVALNPYVISMSYSSLTIMFGAALLVAGALLLQRAESRPNWALGAGLVLAMAALTRFQANAVVPGALVGILLWSGLPVRRRLRAGALVIAGFLLPLLGWSLLLTSLQGGAPANYNFVHLTLAIGRFREFSEVEQLISHYGSLTGVLSEPGAPAAILKFAMLESAKFPFRDGVSLLFLASAWLIPAIAVIAAERVKWHPWLLGMASCFVATSMGARGWVYYYVALIPGLVYLIVSAAEAFDRAIRPASRTIQWAMIVGGLLVASPLVIRSFFRATEWAEWEVARKYVARVSTSADLVTSTAGSFPYGITVRFIDQDRLYAVRDLDSLGGILRRAGVTRLVVTERHSLDEHPELQPFLLDDPSQIPPGFLRDTLIRTPKRLAIMTLSKP